MTDFMDYLAATAEANRHVEAGLKRRKITMHDEAHARLTAAALANGLFIGRVVEELVMRYLPEGKTK